MHSGASNLNESDKNNLKTNTCTSVRLCRRLQLQRLKQKAHEMTHTLATSADRYDSRNGQQNQELEHQALYMHSDSDSDEDGWDAPVKKGMLDVLTRRLERQQLHRHKQGCDGNEQATSHSASFSAGRKKGTQFQPSARAISVSTLTLTSHVPDAASTHALNNWDIPAADTHACSLKHARTWSPVGLDHQLTAALSSKQHKQPLSREVVSDTVFQPQPPDGTFPYSDLLTHPPDSGVSNTKVPCQAPYPSFNAACKPKRYPRGAAPQSASYAVVPSARSGVIRHAPRKIMSLPNIAGSPCGPSSVGLRISSTPEGSTSVLPCTLQHPSSNDKLPCSTVAWEADRLDPGKAQTRKRFSRLSLMTNFLQGGTLPSASPHSDGSSQGLRGPARKYSQCHDKEQHETEGGFVMLVERSGQPFSSPFMSPFAQRLTDPAATNRDHATPTGAAASAHPFVADIPLRTGRRTRSLNVGEGGGRG